VPTTLLAEFFLGGASPVAPAAPVRVSRFRWRNDAQKAYAWRADAPAAFAWRHDGTYACPAGWSDEMASVNHWSQHAGEAKTFVLSPKALLAGVNPYSGWTVRLTVVDERGDWGAADPPAVLLQKACSIDAATGVITCTVTKADTDTIRAAAGGLGNFYHYVERVDASAPLVLDEGGFALEPSALEAP
jgi:hypothetical protein